MPTLHEIMDLVATEVAPSADEPPFIAAACCCCCSCCCSTSSY